MTGLRIPPRPSSLGLIVAALLLLAPAAASADSSSTLTVVGTSDVSDSGLIPNLIQPAFEKAYPQFTFKYVPKGTGAAISSAESGSDQASTLIVHAASLENQFVSGGFSYEQYGRALFTNDFVLGGPTGDPAGVGTAGAHNIAQAFLDIANAGIAGNATFVSRGGTPGTTVEEHKLWSLVAALPGLPSGLLLCAVNSTNGGGDTPIAAGNGVTANGQPCPNSGALPTGAQLPSWYLATGQQQGPNVITANACTGHTGCYVLTDRGTYDYLASGTDPAGSIPALKIVTRDDDATAPGGQYALINYFHGYIINPSKPGETVNVTAAQDFLNFVTSPAVQSQIATYLAHTSDPGGAPFKPTASPVITATLPSKYKAGQALTISGTLANAQPGFPAPSNVKVTINQIVGGLPVPQATGTADTTGKFSIRFVPKSNGAYDLTTGQIAQVEDATLSPVFGDILSPAATTSTTIAVQSVVPTLSVKSIGGRALVVGSFAPGASDGKASVKVLARQAGSKRFKTVATGRIATGEGTFAATAKLKPGTWQVKVSYQDPKQVASSTSRVVKVTVHPATPPGVRTGKLTVTSGKVTLAGSLTAAAAKGTSAKLLALRTGAGAPARFSGVGSVKLHGAKSKFTLHAKLKAGSRWVLLVEYVQNGHAVSYSSLRTITVK